MHSQRWIFLSRISLGVVVLAPYKGSKLVISKKPCILIKIGKEFNWCGQSWNWLRFKYSGLSVALFVPFLFVISILFVFISFCAEELKNHLLCINGWELRGEKYPFTFYTMTGLVLVILRLPCLTCLLWLLIQNSELLKFLVNCLNIWELCKSINDLVSHVIPLKSVLLGMNEEGLGAFT